jgi:hypothetical protein
MSPWREDLDAGPERPRWPMPPNDLLSRERWLFWEQLWPDLNWLSRRYRIRLGDRWWEDDVQVETLVPVAARVERYDSGEWDDQPGARAAV